MTRMSDHHDDRQEHIKKLGELIKGINIAMLTTLDEDGSLRSRPMATQQVEFDGDLYFFTHAGSGKVEEVEQDHDVGVSFADPKEQVYVSVSGKARLVRDKAKMRELWNPALKAWFPKELEDPDIALLKVHAEKAEYWDSPSSAVVHLFGVIKATVTGRPASGGENEKIDLTAA